MPVTTVVKTIGAISILTSLMKPSPSGFIFAPNAGKRCPTRAPRITATMTWKYRLRPSRFTFASCGRLRAVPRCGPGAARHGATRREVLGNRPEPHEQVECRRAEDAELPVLAGAPRPGSRRPAAEGAFPRAWSAP